MKKSAIFLLVLITGSLFSQSLKNRDNLYDYVVITTPEFRDICEAFKAAKEDVSGFRVLVTDTAEIFAEFDSLDTPEENIRHLISYAGTYWQQPCPEYFLLAGNEYMIPAFTETPEIMQDTVRFKDDYYYSRSIYSDDEYANPMRFLVGRVPADNEEDLVNYFNKVIEYQYDKYPYEWWDNALTISVYDTAYPSTYNIRAAEDVAGEFNSNIKTTNVNYIIDNDPVNARDSVFNIINDEGCAYVGFFGGSKDTTFGSLDFITNEYLVNLENENRHFLAFGLEDQNSLPLAERSFTDKLILSKSGAIASVGTPGPVYASSYYDFLPEFVSNIQEGASIGEAVASEVTHMTNPLQRINIWGDPSLVIHLSPVAGTEEKTAVPASFTLHQNYPNPFNPSTTIKFELPEKSFVKLSIYDVTGGHIETIVNSELPAGVHTLNFHPGAHLASGVYMYILRAGDFYQARKMLLLK